MVKTYNVGAFGIPTGISNRIAGAQLTLKYTAHALHEAIRDRYGVLPACAFPQTLQGAVWSLVEAETFNGILSKFVVRRVVDPNHEFMPWPKMARLSREIIVTEKIDGTNGQIYITDLGKMLVGSRTRWITPENDNYGFARWCADHKEDLMKLGPGRHFGEYWGAGIQRRYGLTEKRFSLFNVQRWGADPVDFPGGPGVFEIVENGAANRRGPACCHVVPTLYRGEFKTGEVDTAMALLKIQGSQAAPGFMDAEGVIVYHVAGKVAFKKTFDDAPKGAAL